VLPVRLPGGPAPSRSWTAGCSPRTPTAASPSRSSWRTPAPRHEPAHRASRDGHALRDCGAGP